MAFIKNEKLKEEVLKEGAPKTAERLVEAIKSDKLSFHDFSVKSLYENLVYLKNKPKDPCGVTSLYEERFVEESGSFTSFDAFNVVVSQLLVNLLSTRFNSADFSVQRLFKVVPTNFINGERLPGISNLGAMTQPQMPGRKLEEIEFTQDYVDTPPHQQFGGLLSLSLQLIRSDNTGLIVDTASKMIDALYMGREYEALIALTGIGSGYQRYQYKQKGTAYSATYADNSSSHPWDNLAASQSSLTISSLNTCMQLLLNVLDPYTGQPIATPTGRLTLIVCPELIFTANNIKRQIQYRTGENSSTNYAPVLTSSDPLGSLPFDFDIVVSKYLKKHLDDNTTASTGWWLGWYSEAFAWMQQFAPQADEANPLSGNMFDNVIGRKFRVFRSETAATIEPRYALQATV